MAGILFRLFPCLTYNNPYNLPERYDYLSVLGEGGFGKVLKCRDKRTQRFVAIKIPLNPTGKEEIFMLRMLKANDLEKYNIAEFLDSFPVRSGTALVFELLDISLGDYILKKQCAPMLLSDIRTIIQQVATAFEALKHLGVIHTDVKPDNIVLVDHRTRPFRVKLIDFGLAIPTYKAKRGKILQTITFRSPEVILGLPYSEAIDMWSLGSVMAIMISGNLPFEATHAYNAMQLIVKLLGQPADHLLDDGKYTHIYFTRTESNGWRLKDPEEFWDIYFDIFSMSNKFPPLDDLKKMHLEKKNKAEAKEREQCVELLKAMLEIDGNKRITPSEVLTHPFIDTTNQGYYSSFLQTFMIEKPSCLLLEFSSEHSKPSEPSASAPKDDDITSGIQLDPRGPAPTISSTIVIEVWPATAENTLELDSELEKDIRLQTQMNRTSGNFINLVVKALENEDFGCEPPASALKDDGISNIQADCCSPTKSSLMIEVQRASPENTLQMEDKEGAVSLQAELNKESGSFEEVTQCDKLASQSEDANSGDISMERKKKKKKKKTIFQHIFSWVRKNMRSCCTCSSEDEEGER